jgi:NAD(P)-dependent dehydrogenase (short-subunit alcohol dehydrogenase family)
MAAAEQQLIGGVDVVVANAGIQGFAKASELTADAWDRVFRVNARGTLLTLQLAARILKRRRVDCDCRIDPGAPSQRVVGRLRGVEGRDPQPGAFVCR